MNKKLGIVASALLVTAALGANAAIGGAWIVDEVTISHWPGETYVHGGMAAARDSADNIQYIGCYAYGSLGLSWGYCVAVTASGESASCYAYDADIVGSMRAVHGDGGVAFAFFKGETDCHYVVANNLSYHRR